jgi:hypothetical protein
LAGIIGNLVKIEICNFLSFFLVFQVAVRSIAISCLNAWADAAGIDKFFQSEMIYESLKSNNPFLRIELFNWLAVKLPKGKNAKIFIRKNENQFKFTIFGDFQEKFDTKIVSNSDKISKLSQNSQNFGKLNQIPQNFQEFS